ncbi:MAG: ankyrin repeat domain-containing protein [Verrucomicrobiae bacterium]|nr:ankyrin repeat domain-containing protein [Verrucomicrobiae bacterium]
MKQQTLALFKRHLEADDLAGVADLLCQTPDWPDSVATHGGGPLVEALLSARSTGMLDVFLRHGLDVALISRWWAPGFGLNRARPELAEHLIAKGATLSPHAAAALGLVQRLGELLEGQPERVHAKGGDGGRPLHFARNVETARLLVERGSELDPTDDDHDSTPAQWRIGDAPEVTRFLLQRGARPDVFMAAGLGDLELAKTLVGENPVCTTYRIGHNQGPFPGIGFQKRGGTIYQWTLGFNQSPQEIAHHRGHRDVFDFLMERTPPRQQLLVACLLADEALAQDIATRHPGLVGELDGEDRTLLAKFCWETNLNFEAVRLMLDLGFPIDVPETNHGHLPLHNAAWCGAADLVELLLRRGHPVDRRDPGYHATALGYALHSHLVAKRHPEGDFPRVVRLLLEAGVPLDKHQYPTGDPDLDEVIKAHLEARR